ncbi:hypothetical protein MX851_004574 [Citrobacter freundii]
MNHPSNDSSNTINALTDSGCRQTIINASVSISYLCIWHTGGANPKRKNRLKHSNSVTLVDNGLFTQTDRLSAAVNHNQQITQHFFPRHLE